MNAYAMINAFEDMEADGSDSRNYEPMQRKQRRPEPRRKGHGSSSGGGMHCRRNKHFSWGSGQSARLADLRAFAGAIALALFAMVSSASADTFTWKQVGSIGNAANPQTGLGAVTQNFKISAYETTNAQYAEFLNNSQTGKDGLYGVYDTNMGSQARGGITRSGSAGSYTYSVKTGFENRPVTYVNWFSAARFINWYANGANASAATETGSYTLNGITTGAIVSRNAGAQIFLPSADEWTKAAFYDYASQSYYKYPTASNSTPTGTDLAADLSNPNTANFAQANTVLHGPITVGSYTNTVSTYGLFDMLGNVMEMTDTAGTGANAGRWNAFGASWVTPYTSSNPAVAALSAWTSDVNSQFRLSTVSNDTAGFRVAAVAVPEPGNMVAAAMGIGGLIAVHMIKRRKLALARVPAC